MSLGSANAKTGSLKNDYGDGKGTSAPATWYIALFTDSGKGTELTGTGGISRIAVANSDANWSTSAGQTSNVNDILSDESTAAWASSAGYMALMSAATGGDAWDEGALASAVSVGQSGTVVRFKAGQLAITAA